jgi:membrane protease YdiL (CAAX protease family)
MATRGKRQAKITTFLILTFALSAIFYQRLGSAGSIKAAGGLYSFALMWCPAVAAIVTQLAFERTLRGLGWRLPRLRYLAMGYLLPVVYGLVTYLLVWVSDLGEFSPQQLTATVAPQLGFHPSSPELFAIIYIGVAATLGMVPSLISALGEEIGWRGLLVPELARLTTFTRTALLSGIVWAIWHLPLILMADYNAGTPVWFAIVCFTVMVIAFGLISAWLRLRTGSLWPAVMLHASHNLFIKNIYTPLTRNTGVTPYVIDEFGIALGIALVVIAVYFWHRRSEVAGPAGAPAQAGSRSVPVAS